MEKEGIKTLMNEIPVFEGLYSDEIDLLAGFLEHKKERKGSVLINEGEIDSILYYIVKGEAEVCVNTPTKFETPLVKRRRGETVGEMAVLGLSDVRSATVVALSEIELLILTKENYEKLIEKDVKTAFKILKGITTNLCKRIKELSDEVAFSRLIG